MRIVSLNCRVWTRDTDRKSPRWWRRRMGRIRRFITDEAPDVLCLQELSFPANLWIPKGYRRVGLSVVSCGVVNDGFMMSDHLPLVIEIKRQT